MRTNSRAIHALGGLVFGLLAACVNTAKEAPAQPRFDLGATATSRLPKITLQGSAEFGAKLTLTRTPAFEGSSAPAEQTADPYSARFSYVDVPLAQGLNTFTIVATDSAGQKSPEAKLEVTLDDAPSGLDLTLSAPVVVSGLEGGAGEISATARVRGPVDGFRLDGREVEFTLSGVGSGTKSGTTDAHGRATVTFTGLASTGLGTVSAKLKGDENLSDSATFAVTSGAPASLVLSLRDASATTGGAADVTVAAGTDVAATVTVKDGGQNPVLAPVQLITDAPGALVAGLSIRNLTKAGTFHVVAAVAGVATQGGVAVSAAGTITVQPGAAAKVVFNAPSTAIAGEAFPWSASLTDAFANPVEATGTQAFVLSSATDAALSFDAATHMATFTKAGAQQLTATLTGTTPTATATVPVTVAPAAAATLNLSLSGTDKNPATADLDIDAAADATIGVTYTVTDRFQNAVPAAVSISTDAPALFDGANLRGLTRAGSYSVMAAVQNTTVAAKKTFNVNALKGATIALDLSATSTVAGAPVTYAARALDTFGNVAADAVSLTVDGLQAADFSVDETAKTLTVNKASATAVTVRAKASATGSTLAAATLPLLVKWGAPATIAIDSGLQQTLQAGATPPFTVTVADGLGNVIPNAPVTQAVVPQGATVVEPPGPVVAAGKIYNLIRPGTYLLVAQVAGTALVNDATDPKATLTVTAGDAAAVALTLARTTAEVGIPVDFTTAVKDAYGNAAAGQAVVSVSQGATTIAPIVAGGSWTASATGTYTVTATVTIGPKTITDSKTLTITDAPDLTAPTIAFTNPATDPTIASWPPAGATSPSSCAGAGDVLNFTVTDPSLVADLWVGTAGAASTMANPPSLAFPASPYTALADVCTAGAGQPARGEVLVNVAAADIKGNYKITTAGWCVDPDAASYVPANPPVNRCVLVKQDATAPNAYALAANDAGDLAIAREAANGDALVHFFRRSGGAYGLGTGHALTGFAAPRGVSMVGNTAFTSAISTPKMAVIRTRSLDKTGAGTDDAFVNVDSTTDRFDGVVVGLDGALYATAGSRTASTLGSKLYKFDRPLDLSKTYTTLPTATATSTTIRMTSLCRGPRATELYATGYVVANAKTVPTLVKVTLATGAITTLYTGTVDAQQIGGCAVTNAGIAIGLWKGTGAGQVVLVDATNGNVGSALMSGYTSTSAFDKTIGIVASQGYLFATTSEGSTASLVRFARTGGF